MQELIVCTLLYMLVVATAFSNKSRKVTPSESKERLILKEPARSSVYDISCIFNNEGSPVATKKRKVTKEPAPRPLSQLTVKELRAAAKKRNFAQTYKLSKAELVELLQAEWLWLVHHDWKVKYPLTLTTINI